jgi:hypothetical protein
MRVQAAAGMNEWSGIRWAVQFCEALLPLYAALLVARYFNPDQFTIDFVESEMFQWALWIITGALGGILLFSAALLVFFMIYAPFYLVSRIWYTLTGGRWVDRAEIRFYLLACSFLVLLALLALWDPHWAGVTFVILAGFTLHLWRWFA